MCAEAPRVESEGARPHGGRESAQKPAPAPSFACPARTRGSPCWPWPCMTLLFSYLRAFILRLPGSGIMPLPEVGLTLCTIVPDISVSITHDYL